MALVRVYCGVATAEMSPWLTVAVVDDAGRLLEMRHVSDDPAGYAYLAALLADRSGGAAPVAMDSHEHLVAQLLAAANRPLAIADEVTLDDMSERFADDTSYEEMQAPLSQRRAVGLARGLQAGALYATAQSPSWDLDEFKPVLAAHAAVTSGRQAAAVALREVLRELFPAALRAYPDPAEYIPLRILEAIPEPGLLTASPSSRSRDSALVAELASTGVTDTTTAVNAITALRIAVEESPRWNTNRMLAPVVAETVRQAVCAVRCCDAASAALVGTLVERLGAMRSGATQTDDASVHLMYPAPSAPVSPAMPRRAPGPAAEVPPSRLSPRVSAASAAAAGVPAPSMPAPSMPAASMPAASMPAPFTPAPYTPEPPIPSPRGEPGDAAAGFRERGSSTPGYPTPGYPVPGFPAPGSRSDWPIIAMPDDDIAAVYAKLPASSAHDAASDPTATTLSFSMDPLNAPLDPPADGAPSQLASPWLAGDMPTEPPSLRLVESPPSGPSAGPDRLAPPVLRVIDGGRQPDAVDRPVDDDLLIFSQTHTAWFTEIDEQGLADDALGWGRLADDGWRAAGQSARPAVGAETRAGLPRRVPQANLVPGSAQPPPRQLRIVRDAESIAAHTEGYFRGWRRGQEIGGFAVGQRDRAAWEFNRDQRRDGVDQRVRLS